LFRLFIFYEQVDSVEKIEKLLKGKATELDAEDFTRWQGADYNCLLIEVLTDFYFDTFRCYTFDEYLTIHKTCHRCITDT